MAEEFKVNTEARVKEAGRQVLMMNGFGQQAWPAVRSAEGNKSDDRMFMPARDIQNLFPMLMECAINDAYPVKQEQVEKLFEELATLVNSAQLPPVEDLMRQIAELLNKLHNDYPPEMMDNIEHAFFVYALTAFCLAKKKMFSGQETRLLNTQFRTDFNILGIMRYLTEPTACAVRRELGAAGKWPEAFK